MSHNARTLEAFARLLGIRQRNAYEPASAAIDAAARDIPVVLSHLDDCGSAVQIPGIPPGEKVIAATDLMRQLEQRGHIPMVSAWGIYRLIQRAFLGAGITQFQVVDERVERTAMSLWPSAVIVTRGQPSGTSAQPALPEVVTLVGRQSSIDG